MSGKIDKYEYLAREEILTSDQNKIKEQAKFIYSSLEKAFEKQAKTIKYQGNNKLKQLKSMESNLLNLTNLLKYLIMIVKKIVHHFLNKIKYLMNYLM